MFGALSFLVPLQVSGVISWTWWPILEIKVLTFASFNCLNVKSSCGCFWRFLDDRRCQLMVATFHLCTFSWWAFGLCFHDQSVLFFGSFWPYWALWRKCCWWWPGGPCSTFTSSPGWIFPTSSFCWCNMSMSFASAIISLAMTSNCVKLAERLVLSLNHNWCGRHGCRDIWWSATSLLLVPSSDTNNFNASQHFAWFSIKSWPIPSYDSLKCRLVYERANWHDVQFCKATQRPATFDTIRSWPDQLLRVALHADDRPASATCLFLVLIFASCSLMPSTTLPGFSEAETVCRVTGDARSGAFQFVLKVLETWR